MNDARLLIPEPDAQPWPTLGPEIVDFIEDLLCHGPGDLLGEPVTLTDELRAFLYRAYEVYPRDHQLAGRRRFKRAVLSRRKGVGKTEVAAWLAITELDPASPVRCDGWRKEGGVWIPVGRPVRDPYIPMVAVTEEQTEDLAYGAVYAILGNCDLGNDYEVGLERITHKTAPGKIVALASAPSARDGARTTFQHFDETHLFFAPRLKTAHTTMLRNLAKRRASDSWSLETTTAYAPGAESIAEECHRYAQDVQGGKVADARLLFDHRQASERHDISKKAGLRAAITEASGDAMSFADVEAIESQLHDPQVREEDFRRYWLNQPRKSAARYLDVAISWDPLARPKRKVARGTRIVLGFDGSYRRDSTALYGATIQAKPHIFKIKSWERPLSDPNWRTPRGEVVSEVADAMERFTVVELAPDPPGWAQEVEGWESDYGEVVVRFDTNQTKRFGPACDAFYQAVHDRALSHDGSPSLRRHLANCVPTRRAGYTVVTKSAADSADKIDEAVAAIIAHARAAWHFLNAPPPSSKPLVAVT